MRIARIIAALVILVAAGLVHGSWTNRWKPSRALAELATRLESVPVDVGRWRGSPIEMGDRELAGAGAVGYLSRRYQDESRGTTVTALVVCGLPGDIAAHTPDVCYPGAGFQLGDPSRLAAEVGSPPEAAEFQTAVARRDSPDGVESLRISWAWNDGTGWKSPEEPRWAYAAAPALAKLYLVRGGDGVDEAAEDDPIIGFIDEFLPDLDRRLFGRPVAAGRDDAQVKD